MPRLVGYKERTPHDFGFQAKVAHGGRTWLCTPEFTHEQAPRGSWCDPNGLYMEEGNICIVDVAIDRADVAIDILLGGNVRASLCGPWMKGHLMELALIVADADREGRTEEAKIVRNEMKQVARNGLLRPIIVPVRVSLQIGARLLAGAPEGDVMVHVRTLITREIQ